MKQKQFEFQHKKDWVQFRGLLKQAQKKQNKKVPGDFPFLYRQICNQLSLARSRNYTHQLIDDLEHMALEGHKLLYGTHHFSFATFGKSIFVDYPVLIRKEWKLLLVTLICFFGPIFLVMFAVMQFPHLAYMIAGEENLRDLEYMYDPASNLFEENRELESDVLMWGYYILNNIGIDFKCFAGGIFFGIGSLFYVIYNGIYFGAAAGHINNLEYYETFYPFVVGHSGPELIALVLSGVAGLKIGLALIAPGRLSRLQSLMQAAKVGAKILLGAGLMTFFAAFVEAYWSSRADIPIDVKYSVGAFFWLLLIIYITLSGRSFGTRQA